MRVDITLSKLARRVSRRKRLHINICRFEDVSLTSARTAESGAKANTAASIAHLRRPWRVIATRSQPIQFARNEFAAFGVRATTFALVASNKPILDLQAKDALELVRIRGHDRSANRLRMSRDQQVVAADRPAGRFQF